MWDYYLQIDRKKISCTVKFIRLENLTTQVALRTGGHTPPRGHYVLPGGLRLPISAVDFIRCKNEHILKTC
jgi:hypothetical protein